jgi:hypothetical protein
MAQVFGESDSLLRQVGMVTLYYLLFRKAREEGWLDEITRKKLADFDKKRATNRTMFEIGETTKVDRDLLEFDTYAQSPNDAGALRFRLRVLLNVVFKRLVDEENL